MLTTYSECSCERLCEVPFVHLVAGKAVEMTELGKGKHHIGDFLPPEELDNFLEKVKAIKEGRDPG